MKKFINKKTIGIAVLLAVVIVFPLIFNDNYVLQLVITALFFSYFASCWNIIGGYAGQFALGNALYIGIGAYTAGFCSQAGSSAWLAMLIAGAISVVIAYCISRLCFRLSGTYFALSTVACLYIARYIILSSSKFLGFTTNGGTGMPISWLGGIRYLQFSDKRVNFYAISILLAILLIVSYFIKTRKMGYYLAAIKTNQTAATTIGINVMRYKLIAQCVCAFFMAIGGVFYAMMMSNVNPYTVLGYDTSLEIMLYSVIGGSGTLFGPVVGAFLLNISRQVLKVQVGASMASLATVFYGVLLIVVVRFAPDGLASLPGKVINWIKKISNKRAVAKGKEGSTDGK